VSEGPKRNSRMSGAAVAAALAGLVEQFGAEGKDMLRRAIEARLPRLRASSSRTGGFKANGGHRRKRAIREARARKYGTKHHGKYRL
jgi:hypothetical protein